MGKPSAPEPADPKETGAAQTSVNIGSAIAQQHLNNVNQVTPDGSLTYDQTGSYDYRDPLNGTVHDIPTFTATQTLSEAQQAIKDQGDRANLNLATLGADQSGRLNDLLGRPMDQSTLPDRAELGDAGAITKTYSTDFSEDRQRVEDALMERMNPGLERDHSRLESRLASQGIRLGSEAYSAAMSDYGQQTNDARLGAILGAGQEQSRLVGLEADRAGFENVAQQQEFGQTVQRGNFDNGARTQALQEQFAIRNQPINEITALMSGSQVQNPNFINPQTAQLATTDFAGIQGQYDNLKQRQYEQQAAQSSSLMSGVLGFGANMLSLSDERTKTDIKKVGKTDDGQNIYQFRYKSGGPIQMGLMAQEVEEKKPEAVHEVGGIKMVDYKKATA